MPPASRDASVCRGSLPARPRVTADGSSLCGRATTIGSCRCSRKGSPRSATWTSSFGSGFSAVSAGALRDEHSRDRRDKLSREAVEVARRAKNPVALAYALEGRGAAILGPDSRAELLALSGELRELAERIGDPERVVQAHIYRLIAQLELGNIPEGQVDLAAAGRIAEELRQPAQLWLVASAQAMLALAVGRLDVAETLIHNALVLGEGALPESAIPVNRLQLYTLADFRGNLERSSRGSSTSSPPIPPVPSFVVSSRISARG